MIAVRDTSRGRRSRPLPLALLLAVATACGGDAPAADVPAAAAAPRDTATLTPAAAALAGLVTVPAESLAWRERWTAPARLRLDPAATQALGAIAEGRVTRVPVRVGDVVAAGQLLVAIHSHEMLDARRTLAAATAAATEARTALALATTAVARAERLVELRALARAELDRAHGELAHAQARDAQARAELERATALTGHLLGGVPSPLADEHEVLVRAPMAGVVVGLAARAGEVVLVGAPLVTVAQPRALLLSLHLPEQALAAAAPGADVRFTVPAYPDERLHARVVRIAPTVDSLTRTVEVQATVAGAPPALRAEMFATAELLGPPGAATLVVPTDALQTLDGETVVIVARPVPGGTQLEAVRVRVGRRDAARAEIIAGLVAGTPVVVEGAAIARAELLRRRSED